MFTFLIDSPLTRVRHPLDPRQLENVLAWSLVDNVEVVFLERKYLVATPLGAISMKAWRILCRPRRGNKDEVYQGAVPLSSNLAVNQAVIDSSNLISGSPITSSPLFARLLVRAICDSIALLITYAACFTANYLLLETLIKAQRSNVITTFGANSTSTVSFWRLYYAIHSVVGLNLLTWMKVLQKLR